MSRGKGAAPGKSGGFVFFGQDTEPAPVKRNIESKKPAVGGHPHIQVLADDPDSSDDDGNKKKKKNKKRKGGSGDPVGLTGAGGVRSKSKGLNIPSAGRVMAITGQAEIAERVAIQLDLYDIRSRTAEDQSVAPLGDRADFEIHEGDLMYGDPRDRVGVRHSTNGYPDMKGFAHLGGYEKGAPLYFIGQCKNRSADGAYEMAVVTAVMCGTITTVNNGQDTILPDDDIYFTTDLYVSPHGNTIKPVVTIKGQPITKFTPTLRVYRYGNLSSVRETIDKLQRGVPEGKDGKSTYDSIQKATSAHFTLDGEHYGATQPIHVWALWNALDLAVRTATWLDSDLPKATKDLQGVARLLLEVELKCYDRDERLETELTTRGVMTSDTGGAALRPVTEVVDSMRVLTHSLPALIGSRKDHALMEQQRFARSCVIGRALTSAVPGKQFDIILGYFHS